MRRISFKRGRLVRSRVLYGVALTVDVEWQVLVFQFGPWHWSLEWSWDGVER